MKKTARVIVTFIFSHSSPFSETAFSILFQIIRLIFHLTFSSFSAIIAVVTHWSA